MVIAEQRIQNRRNHSLAAAKYSAFSVLPSGRILLSTHSPTKITPVLEIPMKRLQKSVHVDAEPRTIARNRTLNRDDGDNDDDDDRALEGQLVSSAQLAATANFLFFST